MNFLENRINELKLNLKIEDRDNAIELLLNEFDYHELLHVAYEQGFGDKFRHNVKRYSPFDFAEFLITK